ncbi:hypothetical protein GE061_005577 [Apolygus lucorum]|uniref:Uncharacterized protein n=1 Tax=Apolygus lucorum TaxID=248454 RepID=A0A6A4IXQ5_APOLU|nr:hypothetical protein GE061_005577 [Apolygus lucorum]
MSIYTSQFLNTKFGFSLLDIYYEIVRTRRYGTSSSATNIPKVPVTTMKYLIVLLFGAVCIHENNALFGIKCPRKSLKAKYSLAPWAGYYDIPKTSDDDLMADYVQIDEETAKLDVPGTMWCRPEDPRVCLIMDTKGQNVGMQISFLDQDTEGVVGYDYSAVNTYTRTNIFNVSANSMRVYFTNPKNLTSEGRAASDETVDGVWTTLKGELVELPKTDPKVTRSGNFYRQSCFPQMGQHYFYDMYDNMTDCSQHVPFFGIYHNGENVGFGIANYGKASTAENGRDWYETVPLLGVKMIMPHRPQCVDDLVTKNGLYSLHVYFVEFPYLIGCLFQ